MKIYIMTDMEGISGISREEAVMIGTPQYESARELLCQDINAAVDGAFAGGATEVIVCDGHGGGHNLRLPLMDERGRYECPNGARDYMPGLDETFSGVLMVGYHAMAGTQNAFLDHTMISASWYDYAVNGRSFGEIAQVATWAGSFGVPVLMVTGDQAACTEAEAFLPGVATVVVKQGIGRQKARCVHPAVAREAIARTARQVVSQPAQVAPFEVKFPARVDLQFCQTKYADDFSRPAGLERTGPRSVVWTANSIRELL